jgi:hypothetical protein
LTVNSKQLTEEDFHKSGYDEIIDGCGERECNRYATIFLKKARELESGSDSTKSEIFTLIGRLTSLNLRLESAVHPFSPKPTGPIDAESPEYIQIFDREHINLLINVVSSIKDFELQARVADVIWVIDRNYKIAEIALTAYLESAKILEHPEQWTSCEKRIHRAFQLANLLGSRTEQIEKVLQHIEYVLDKYDGNDPLFLSQRMMSLLLEAKHGDPDKYIKLSEKCALDAEEKNSFHRARAYWQVKARWHRHNKDSGEERESLINNAKAYVKEAEFKRGNDGQGSYLVASHFLQRAIEAYRRIGNTKDQVDRIHRMLLDYEQKSLNEMQHFSTEFDASESVKEAVEKVSGKDFFDAIFALSLMVKSPKIKDLEIEVKKHANQYPLQHLMSGVAVNHSGKVIARQASMFSSDPKEVEEAARQNMLKHAEFHRLFITQAFIEPARHQIFLEHNAQLSDFMPIVHNNLFVPEGRENIYAQGLLKGLEGDFLCAAHLLIPQIENSFRYILRAKGAMTSGVDSNGIQDERSLNDTLFAPEIQEVFGPDIIFDLQGILVERFGANLRNRMAHGLMEYTAFFSVDVSYLWALTLRLCCWPLIVQKYQDQNNAESTHNNKKLPNKANSAVAKSRAAD